MTPHGTPNGYQHHGCRCGRCTAAESARVLAWRESRSGLAEGDPRHGTVGGYTNWGCRCGRCREATRCYQLAWRAKRRAS